MTRVRISPTRSFCWVAVLLAVVTSACSRPSRLVQQGPITSNTVVATVDGTPITLGEVLEETTKLTTPGVNMAATLNNGLNEVITRRLAYLSTDRFTNYDKTEVHRLARNRAHDVIIQYMLNDVIGTQVAIPDSSIDSAYRANLPYLSTPERRSVTHLLMSSNPLAWKAAGVDVSGLSAEQLDAKAKEQIEEYYRAVKNGADLGDLAAKYTHDSGSKPKRGSSGLFQRGQMVEEFERVAFKLPKGVLSSPFKSVYGWHILRVDEIVDSTVKPLDAELRSTLAREVRSQVQNRLASQWLDSVAARASFEWNEKLLEKNVGDYDPYDWVCIVSGVDTIPAVILRETELIYRTGRSIPGGMTPELRKDLILGKVTPYILGAAARQLGYADSDSMKRVYREYYKQEVVSRIYRDRGVVVDQPSDAEIKRYYEKHREDFVSDKPLRLQQIVFQDSVQAAEVKGELDAGADFKEAAAKYRVQESGAKETIFDLGWVSRESIPPEVYDIAWITSVGKYTEPIRTLWGYHVVKVVDRKSMRNFEAAKLDVKQIIMQAAQRKKSEEWLKWLNRGHEVVKYDDILGQVDYARREYYYHLADSLQKEAADTVKSGS